ncbi:MAG: response regulator [Nanoarchaeota archaeon]
MTKKPADIKIGIIDDHVQTAVSLSQLLDYNGFKTFQAYNVKDAIAKAKKEKPDLLLLDIRLGNDEEGYDIAKELPKQKVLFMSGFEIDRDKIKSFKNAIGALEKPVDIRVLLKVIRKEFKLQEFNV